MSETPAPTQSQNPGSPLQRLIGGAKKTWAWYAGISAFAGACVFAYNWVVPHVDINPGEVGSDIDPLASEFVVANNGNFTLKDVLIRCDIYYDHSHMRSQGNVTSTEGRPEMGQGAEEIIPGMIATRDCLGGGIIKGPGAPHFPATFVITTNYMWGLNWPGTKTGTFTSVKDAEGHIHVERNTPR